MPKKKAPAEDLAIVRDPESEDDSDFLLREDRTAWITLAAAPHLSIHVGIDVATGQAFAEILPNPLPEPDCPPLSRAAVGAAEPRPFPVRPTPTEDPSWWCGNCGDPDVEERDWVRIRDGFATGTGEAQSADDFWCGNCEEHGRPTNDPKEAAALRAEWAKREEE